MFSNDEMDFSELIQSYFLKRTGKGLIFSSRDLDLLLKWEASGCSVGTICKGIDAAVERSNRTPRDLFACRKFVEEGMGIKKSVQPAREKKSPQLSKPTPSIVGERGELIEMVKRYARQNPHQVFEELYRDALKELSDTSFEFDAYVFEEAFFEKAFKALPPTEQKTIDEKILEKLSAVLSTMSPKARAATLGAKRRDFLEEKMNAK